MVNPYLEIHHYQKSSKSRTSSDDQFLDGIKVESISNRAVEATRVMIVITSSRLHTGESYQHSSKIYRRNSKCSNKNKGYLTSKWKLNLFCSSCMYSLMTITIREPTITHRIIPAIPMHKFLTLYILHNIPKIVRSRFACEITVSGGWSKTSTDRHHSSTS